MDDYFTITQARNQQQRLLYFGLYTEGEALEWWKANRHRYATWEEVREAIKEYYSNYYKLDRALVRSAISNKQELSRNT